MGWTKEVRTRDEIADMIDRSFGTKCENFVTLDGELPLDAERAAELDGKLSDICRHP
jgi:hypothetical protein